MTSPLTDTLTKAGFDLYVALIYVALAEGGEMGVPALQKKTTLSRAAIYDGLNLLMADGYVFHRKKGRSAFYQAEHPNKLLALISEKQRETALLSDEIKNTVQTLTGSYNLANNKPGVKFYEGDEGIREVTFDSLKSQGDILTFLDVDATQRYVPGMNKEYVEKRVKLNIKKRMIVPDTPATRVRYANYSPLLEVKLLPKDMKPFKTIVQIYNNTVSFSTLNEEKKIGIIIEDTQITDLHRNLFEYMWRTLPIFKTIN